MHKSVLLDESIENLNLNENSVIVDATLGYAGHSSEILKRIPSGKLIAFDQDDEAIKSSNEKLKKIANNYEIIKSNFVNLKEELSKRNIKKIDGILFDLGVSSPQLDEDYRGFSFHQDALLDMRMDQTRNFSAYNVVNEYSFDQLVDVFYKYGNEIVNFINKQSQFMGISYRQNSYCDDVVSDTILYITQKRGDLFINFSEGKALRILKCIAKKYIKYSYLSYMRVRKISLDEKDERLGKEHHKYTVDKKEDVEKMVLEKIDEEAKSKYLQCINLLQQYYDKGVSSTETIERVCQELKISKKEVLAILKQRLLEKQQSERSSFEEYCL